MTFKSKGIPSSFKQNSKPKKPKSKPVEPELDRDHLAILAMQGYLSRSDMAPSGTNEIASLAYSLADAMLVERRRPPAPEPAPAPTPA